MHWWCWGERTFWEIWNEYVWIGMTRLESSPVIFCCSYEVVVVFNFLDSLIKNRLWKPNSKSCCCILRQQEDKSLHMFSLAISDAGWSGWCRSQLSCTQDLHHRERHSCHLCQLYDMVKHEDCLLLCWKPVFSGWIQFTDFCTHLSLSVGGQCWCPRRWNCLDHGLMRRQSASWCPPLSLSVLLVASSARPPLSSSGTSMSRVVSREISKRFTSEISSLHSPFSSLRPVSSSTSWTVSTMSPNMVSKPIPLSYSLDAWILGLWTKPILSWSCLLTLSCALDTTSSSSTLTSISSSSWKHRLIRTSRWQTLRERKIESGTSSPSRMASWPWHVSSSQVHWSYRFTVSRWDERWKLLE